MTDQTVTLRIQGENGQLVGVIRASKTELAGLGTQAQTTGQQGSRGARGLDDLGSAAQRTQARAGGLRSELGLVKNLIAGLVGVQTIAQLRGMADGYTDIVGKLRQTANSERELQKAKADTFRIAQQTYQSLDATTTLYQRAYGALKQYHVGQEQIAAMTETVNRGLLISRASTAESASAMLQLSQALGAGALRGEEFNAMNEAAPRLMQLLADSLGVARGALKKMAEDGKLTTEVLLKAFTGPQAKALATEAAQVPLTISRAWLQLRNETMRYVGEADQASSVSARVAASIGVVAKHLDLLAAAATTVATFFAGRYVGAILAATAAKVRGTVATVSATVAEQRAAQAAVVSAQAQVRAALATGASMAASNALSAANARLAAATVASRGAIAGLGAGMLSFVGGPVGAILIAVGLLVQRFMSLKAAADQARGSMATVGDAAAARDARDRDAMLSTGGKLLARKQQLNKDIVDLQRGIDGIGPGFAYTMEDGKNGILSESKMRDLQRVKRAELAETQRQLDLNAKAVQNPNFFTDNSPQIPNFDLPPVDVKVPKAAKARAANSKSEAIEEQKRWREEALRAVAIMNGPLKEAEFNRDQRIRELDAALKKGSLSQADHNTLVSDAKRVYDEEALAINKANEELKKRQAAPETLLRDMDREVKLLGMTEDARELANEQLRAEEEMTRAVADAIDAKRPISEKEIANLQEEARARAGAIVAQRKQQEAAQNFYRATEQGLQSIGDASVELVMSGFKDWKGFWTSLGNTAKQWVAQILAEIFKLKVVKPLMDSLFGGSSGGFFSSILGGGSNGSSGGFNWMGMWNSFNQSRANGGGFWQSLAAAVGGGSAGSNGYASAGGGQGNNLASTVGMLYQGYKAYGAIAGMWGGASAAAAGGVSAAGSGVASGIASGVSGASGASSGAAAAGGSSAAGAVATVAWVAAIVAAMYQGNEWYQEGWQYRGSDVGKYKYASPGNFIATSSDDLLVKLGVSEHVAGWLTGSAGIARMWGYKQPTLNATGIQGSVGFDGLDGQSWAQYRQKVGMVRKLFGGKDKLTTVTGALDSSITDAFQEVAHNVKDRVDDVAEQLGMDLTQSLSQVRIDIGRIQFDADPAKAKQQIQDKLTEIANSLSEAAIQAMGFGQFLDSGHDADALFNALSVAIGLTTESAKKLGRALNAVELQKVSMAMEWFIDQAKQHGATLADEIQRVANVLGQYGELISSVEAELKTAGLNEYQRAMLSVETTYRQQVQQANDLAKALGLSGARAEDLAKIEALRAKRMADVQIAMEKQKDTFLDQLAVSQLSPLSDQDKLGEARQSFQDAIRTGDISGAQQWMQEALGLARNLYASGSDYNAVYNDMTSAYRGMGVPSLTMDDGTTMGDLAQILLDTPQAIARALFAAAIDPNSVLNGSTSTTGGTTTTPVTGPVTNPEHVTTNGYLKRLVELGEDTRHNDDSRFLDRYNRVTM